MNKVIALWAHPRAVSTAFLRMMIERGDVIVVHEPLVTLVDEGEVPITDGRGGTVVLRSPIEVIRHLKSLTTLAPVFCKDTCEFQYEWMFDHPEEMADIEHTFIVRDPKKAINSHYYVKPTVTCPEIGYEHLYRIFEFAQRIRGKRPPVIHSERLLQDPETVIRRYCELVGLPFIREALTWNAEDRPEWQRTQIWHQDVARSTGFVHRERSYEVTVDNHEKLRSFYDYHYPFYRHLAEHAI
jgi:hypothetical protein